jgi:hypothetical protein
MIRMRLRLEKKKDARMKADKNIKLYNKAEDEDKERQVATGKTKQKEER